MSDNSRKRVNLYLPINLLADADSLAGILGVSRSALFAHLLSEAIPPLLEFSSLIELGKLNPSGVVKRARGCSSVEIGVRLSELLEAYVSDADSTE